jgi:translation initiation factor 2 alpha subunit (eIF-2alpha)
LAKAKDSVKDAELRYRGSGRYSIRITSEDYKKGEKSLQKATDSVINHMEKNKGAATFERQDG